MTRTRLAEEEEQCTASSGEPQPERDLIADILHDIREDLERHDWAILLVDTRDLLNCVRYLCETAEGARGARFEQD